MTETIIIKSEEEILVYVKTPGWALLEGNKVTDAQLGVPLKWTNNHVLIRDMKIDPETIKGKYYNPKDRKFYLNYDCRSGAYNNVEPISQEDIQEKAITEAVDIVIAKKELESCNLMVKFADELINTKKIITSKMIPEYVNDKLISVLGESKYIIEEETGVKEITEKIIAKS